MKIAIASDHGGYELKEQIKDYFLNKSNPLTDLGTYSLQSVDYPDYAAIMAECLLKGNAELGILICGTGIGISIAANRYKGIRAALIYSKEVAELAKRHNNANVLVFGGRTMKYEDVIQNIEIFLNATFEGGRHENRLKKLDKE